MGTQPILVPRTDMAEASEQEKAFPISVPFGFGAAAALLVALYPWGTGWLISGTPALTFSILLGASQGYRVLPFIPIWVLLAAINVIYAIAGTSWLLHGVFTVLCWPTILITCLFQFDATARLARRSLRKLLLQLSFVNDKIALFDVPALEIDTDVDGLMVIRGITLSLSTLTVVAHGIEVGIKLTDDMELAISCEKVTIPLFRKIIIEDCFAGLKGGEYEMTFGKLDESTENANGDALMLENTALLKAASAHGVESRPKLVTMTSRLTDGETLTDSSAHTVLESMKQLSLDEGKARKQYEETIKWIEKTNTIEEARQVVLKRAKAAENVDGDVGFDWKKDENLRAAICSQMHDKPSIPHPPKNSIKVTTLKNMSSLQTKRFMHRLPLLLRLLLGPLAYFHPITISSITAGGSGSWLSFMLKKLVFKEYAKDNAELARLEERVLSWLSDANFVVELATITGLASVPINSIYDIVCYIGIVDVMAYRTLPKEISLNQVIRIGGADATVTVPSFLLPHHEHILPPKPTKKDFEEKEQEIDEVDGKPQTVQKEKELEQIEKDETNVKVSAHAHLPACLDQELLDFIAALVKATKVVELEKEPSAMDEEIHSLADFGRVLNKATKESVKKGVVDSIMSDRLIAKLVGKVTTKLETLVGDVGYSGAIPVALEPYRLPENHPEMNKLLL